MTSVGIYKIQKKFITYLSLACLGMSLVSCSNSKKEVAPETVMTLPEDKTNKGISEALGATPASKEKNKESGISAENYENYTFAGYDGTITFYYGETGNLMYYKWYIGETDTKKAKNIYNDVCTALTGSYGEGVEKNAESTGLYTTSWETEKEPLLFPFTQT